jgi:FkbM family methyltransferase
VFCKLPQVLAATGVTPRHLVHVGAHEAQEWPWYQRAGVQRVTWVEPIPELAQALRVRFAGEETVDVVECACGDTPGTAALSVTEPTNVSTLLTPGPLDRVVRTIDVPVRRLADVAPGANIAVIDAQGFELQVMAGAPWEALDLMVVEACTVNDPTIAASYPDVTALAAGHGFQEICYWPRDYQFIHQFARGRDTDVNGDPVPDGEVRDVVLARVQG